MSRHTPEVIKDNYNRFVAVVPYQGYYGGTPADRNAIQTLSVSKRLIKKKEFMAEVLKHKPLYIERGIHSLVVYGVDDKECFTPSERVFERVAKTQRVHPNIKKQIANMKGLFSEKNTLEEQLKLNKKFTKLLLKVNLVEFDPSRWENKWRENGGGFYI